MDGSSTPGTFNAAVGMVTIGKTFAFVAGGIVLAL